MVDLRGFALLLFAALGFAGEPGMVFIPGGEFQRGRTFDWPDVRLPWYPEWLKDDVPVRPIRVDPFHIGEHEVTNEQYAAFVVSSKHRVPYHWRRGAIPEGKADLPVVNVDWEDARAFCQWDGGKRLPTEAEWERAARGLAEGKMFSWGDQDPSPALAHYAAADGPLPVCSKKRNYFGLCDMLGNVWEWTADYYDRQYFASAPADNPRGPDKRFYRVVRGGSWFDEPKPFLTVSYRSWARPPERSATIGFRCAKSFTTPRVVQAPDDSR
jgi:formylglycine-generating enzyme required for sulfatase activity